jgi:hypothetical protein
MAGCHGALILVAENCARQCWAGSASMRALNRSCLGQHTSKQVGNTGNEGVRKPRCRRDWFEENDPEGVAFE